jgi:hypothetical protein
MNPPAPDVWLRVERLFHQALDLPLDARKAFLEQACSGDKTLYEEVETLLGYAKAPQSELSSHFFIVKFFLVVVTVSTIPMQI